MIDAPLALAFTAGLVATVNPCGFAMLPAYLSWYLGTDTTDTTATDRPSPFVDRLGRALLVGGTVSVGFLIVFGIAGTLITAGVRSFIDYVPWVALLIGAALALLGIALLAGRDLTVALPKPQAGTQSRRPRSMLAFGASYAVASLSCTLPVFLAVVASTFTRTDLASGVATFGAYAAGMSVVLLAVTIALALAQHTVVRRVRAIGRHLNRIAGALLIVAGGYIVYYWAFNLATDPGETTGAGPARFIEGLSADANRLVQNLGWQAMLVFFGTVTAASALVVATARRHARPTNDGGPHRRKPSSRMEGQEVGRVPSGNAHRGARRTARTQPQDHPLLRSDRPATRTPAHPLRLPDLRQRR
ncbi:MAG: cytochrome c biogenesis CcdA family protein [Acidimicrobiales bacterium]